MMRIFIALLLLSFSAGLSVAATECDDNPILDSKNKNSSGVCIQTKDWSEAQHADASYRFYQSARNAVISKDKNLAIQPTLGQNDFYYSLEIVPQFHIVGKNCTPYATLGSFLSNLVGVSTGALVIVKTGIQYRWSSGAALQLLPNDSVLAVAALGPSSTSATAGNGCFFDHTLRPTFPWTLYRGGGGTNDTYDDFVMKFIVQGARVTKLNAVSNLVRLLGEISVAAGSLTIARDIASPAFQNVQKVSQDFQTALQDAGSVQNQVAVHLNLKLLEGKKIVITMPKLFGSENDGNLTIYVRRQASLALSNNSLAITPSTIFDNQALVSRQCALESIALGSCSSTSGSGSGASSATTAAPPAPAGSPPTKPPVSDSKGGDSLRVTLAKLMSVIDKSLVTDGNYSPIVKLIDANDPQRQLGLYKSCQALRTVVREYLHLSSLDEMAIRWAVTTEGGFQSMLKDPQLKDLRNLVEKINKEPSNLAKPITADQLKNMCWSDVDDKLFNAVIVSLGKHTCSTEVDECVLAPLTTNNESATQPIASAELSDAQ